MNSHLSHQMAQLHQQDLCRAGEGARKAAVVSGPSWFRGFAWKLASSRPSRTEAPVRAITGVAFKV